MNVHHNKKSNGKIRIRPKNRIIPIQPSNQGSSRLLNSKTLIKYKKLMAVKAMDRTNPKIIYSKKHYQWEIQPKIF